MQFIFAEGRIHQLAGIVFEIIGAYFEPCSNKTSGPFHLAGRDVRLFLHNHADYYFPVNMNLPKSSRPSIELAPISWKLRCTAFSIAASVISNLSLVSLIQYLSTKSACNQKPCLY